MPFWISSVGHDGTVYVFPPWKDGSIEIMAATGAGVAVRVVLDPAGVRELTEILGEAIKDSPSCAKHGVTD